ncbi:PLASMODESMATA CALLOSE-BINDING PROTEIN 2-like [Henckelia pumila]|uniref:PLASMODESMATA CALLOSE-BINDING PROTEIN 2-like n=1 Tax=Henckelia pumila TaxID=405737 RepID=UPI003C6E9B6B
MAAAAALVFIIALLFGMAHHSSAIWCVCKEGMSDTELQKTLDYACGSGADCNPTHQNGPCFNPNTVKAHCSYAVNSYFQKNRQSPAACNFTGTATVVSSDPSAAGGCAYPATASSSSTTPVTTVSGTPSTTNTNGGSPLVTTPTGVLGGPNNGLGPSGINTDVSGAEIRLPRRFMFWFSVLLVFAGLLLE